MKDNIIKVRVTTDDKETIVQQAKRNGLDVSTYIRFLLENDRQNKGGLICKQ